MARNEELDPNYSPDFQDGNPGKPQTRRMNSIPIYIAIGIFILFALLMIYVANDTGEDSGQKQQLNVGDSKGNAQEDADSIIAKMGIGDSAIVGSKDKENVSIENNSTPTTPTPTPTPTPTTISSAPPSLQMPPMPPQELEVSPIEQEVQTLKRELFRTAVAEATVVDTSLEEPEVAERSKDNRNSTASPSDDYVQRVNSIRQAQTGSTMGDIADGMALIQANKGKDYSQFDSNGEDRWSANTRVDIPRSPFLIRAGDVIPGTMITGINSDLPGQITGQVSRNVYDTATGNYLIIPQGTKIIGSYSSEVAYGQQAVLIAWQRLVFPDGKALDIGSMPGGDSAGYSGFRDKTDNHLFRVFTSALLMSTITAGVSYSQDRGHDNDWGDNNRTRMSDEMSEALGQTFGQVISQIVAKNLNVAPTVEIRPGYEFNIIAVKDLSFSRPYSSFDYKGDI